MSQLRPGFSFCLRIALPNHRFTGRFVARVLGARDLYRHSRMYGARTAPGGGAPGSPSAGRKRWNPTGSSARSSYADDFFCELFLCGEEQRTRIMQAGRSRPGFEFEMGDVEKDSRAGRSHAARAEAKRKARAMFEALAPEDAFQPHADAPETEHVYER